MQDCIFCKIVLGNAPSWKVDEDEYTYAFLDKNPVNEYHTLVVSRTHYRDIFDIPEVEAKRLISMVKRLVTRYHRNLGINNVQIINRSGAEAQQETFHIHFHIVPRHTGDGQDLKYRTRPELRSTLDNLLARLRD